MKKELVLIIRDKEGKIVAIINRIDGEQKYEIYTTQIASTDDVEELFTKTQAKI